MNKFEVYENNGGGILLYLFKGEEVKKVFEGWECGEKGGLLNAINQLVEDPDAWESWDRDLVESDPYAVVELYQADVGNSDLIAFGHFGAFTLYVNEMGTSGQFVFGIDD